MIDITNAGKDMGAVINASVKETLDSNKIVLDGTAVPAQGSKKRISVKFIVRTYDAALMIPTGHDAGPPEMWREVKELSDGQVYEMGKLYSDTIRITASGHCVAIAKCLMEDTTEEPYEGGNEII